MTKKKKVRNKARDIFTDYYKANRQAEKENIAAGEKQEKKKSWSISEKVMLVIIVIGLIGIFVRYVILR